MWLSVCLLLLSLSVGLVSCSNVDTSEALWFRSADPNSYFGYSVNLYRNRNKPSMRYVLIGAPRANSSSELFQTGNTFRCDALDPNSCTALDLPDLSTANARNDLGEASGEVEDKSTMWMGGTVTSSYETGAVVTTGHRYFDTQGFNRRNPLGLAYILSDALSPGVKYIPCGGSCDPRLLGFGQCMAGTSSLILSDGSQLYLGATGYNYFRGTVFRGMESTNCQSGIFVEPVSFFGYMGYALAAGRLLSRDEDTIVSSGPRQNGHLGNIFLISNNTATSLNSILSVHGTSQEAYFGFSLLTIDLNGDGLDELLVSAPIYSLPGQIEIGQVHVFTNDGSGLGTATTVIQQVPYARFGTAMADLGDLNKDGYPEVAISAPYGNQAGTVYIYSGTSQGVLSSSPIQTIRGEDVGLGRGAGFGVSVSGKQDMDSNGYNDIIVGAYVNSSAFLFRTLPVVAISITPSSNPAFAIINIEAARQFGFNKNLSIDGQAEIEYAFFRLNFPVSYSSSGESPPTIRLNLTINSDPERQSSRVFFESNGTSSRYYQREIDLTRDNVSPQTADVYIRDLDSQAFKFNFSYSAINPAPLDFSSSVIISNPRAVPIFSVELDLMCGEDHVCTPDLFITADIVFPTKDTNTYERYTAIIAGEVNQFSIDISVGNRGEDSFGTQMILTLPPGISFRLAVAHTQYLVIGCQNTQKLTNKTILSCSPLGNPLKGYNSSTVRFSVVFNSDTVRGDEGNLQIQLEVLSNNLEANSTRSDNKKTVDIRVITTADITTSLQLFPNQLPFNTSTKLRINNLINTENQTEIFQSDLGHEVTYLFLVHNNGPSPIFNTTLDIHWPFGLKDLDSPNDRAATHFFLYPTKYESDKITCDSTYFNVAELRDSKFAIDEGRNTRSIEITEGKLYVHRSRRDTGVNPTEPSERIVFNTDISCVDYHEYCVTIKCRMGEIHQGISYELRVTANVFETTLVVNAPASIWEFTVFSEVFIQDQHVVQPVNDEPDNSRVKLRLIPSSIIGGNKPEGYTQWWMIILAIIVFLLIMIPSVVALYFCGFFKRNQSYSYNAKLEQSSIENI